MAIGDWGRKAREVGSGFGFGASGFVDAAEWVKGEGVGSGDVETDVDAAGRALVLRWTGRVFDRRLTRPDNLHG